MGADRGPGARGTRGAGAEPRVLPIKTAEVQAEQRHDRQSLGWPATLFIAGVSAAGVGLISWYAPHFNSSDTLGLVLLTLLAVLADRLAVSIYGETHLSVSFIPIFAVGLLYGPTGVAIAGPIAAVAVHIPRQVFTIRLPFDVGNVTIAITLAAVTFEAMAGLTRDEVRPVMLPAALTAAAVAYVVNAYLVSQVASLTTGRSVLEVWLEKGRWLFPHYVVFGLLGLALAVAYRALGVTGLLAFVAPPIMMQLSIKQYVERTTETVTALRRKNEELEEANSEILEMTETLRETYDGTLEALVTALDARDRETKGHSTRVTEYTLDIARRLGLQPGAPDWEDLKGYGAGRDDFSHPNLLRLMIGTPSAISGKERVIVIETNIDDMNPQLYDYVMERLLGMEVQEVFLTPIIMKKNRPGTLLTVICPPEKLPSIIEFVLTETTTLGLRWHEEERERADREILTLRTRYGKIRFKLGRWEGKVVNLSPEYEDCKGLALKKRVPLKDVFEEAKRVAATFQKDEPEVSPRRRNKSPY